MTFIEFLNHWFGWILIATILIVWAICDRTK